MTMVSPSAAGKADGYFRKGEKTMEENNTMKILYSYDRESYNDEEARKRYTAYMMKMMELMAETQKKGGNKR